MKICSVLSLCLLSLLTTTACKKTDQPPPPPTTEPAAGSGSAAAGSGSGSAAAGSGSGSAAAGSGSGSAVADSGLALPVSPPSEGPKGLAAKNNNPKLVTAAAKMADCKIDQKYPNTGCDDQMKPFVDKFDKAKDLDTVFNLLDDPSEKVRYLGARIIMDNSIMPTEEGMKYAARLLGAATAETDPAVAMVIAGDILGGNFHDKTYADGVHALLEKHPLPAMRATLASDIANKGDEWFPIIMARFAADKDASVRAALVQNFQIYGEAAKVCPFLLDAMKDPDNIVAGTAGYTIYNNDKCKDSYDAYLAALKAHTAATKATYEWVIKAESFGEAKGASDAQKAAFLDVMKSIVADTKVDGQARQAAIEAVGKYAKPEDAKKFAADYVKDADGAVSASANMIVSK